LKASFLAYENLKEREVKGLEEINTLRADIIETKTGIIKLLKERVGEIDSDPLLKAQMDALDEKLGRLEVSEVSLPSYHLIFPQSQAVESFNKLRNQEVDDDAEVEDHMRRMLDLDGTNSIEMESGDKSQKPSNPIEICNSRRPSRNNSMVMEEEDGRKSRSNSGENLFKDHMRRRLGSYVAQN
jgi:hypothetical protein